MAQPRNRRQTLSAQTVLAVLLSMVQLKPWIVYALRDRGFRILRPFLSGTASLDGVKTA
jgi:hypothetical protein